MRKVLLGSYRGDLKDFWKFSFFGVISPKNVVIYRQNLEKNQHGSAFWWDRLNFFLKMFIFLLHITILWFLRCMRSSFVQKINFHRPPKLKNWGNFSLFFQFSAVKDIFFGQKVTLNTFKTIVVKCVIKKWTFLTKKLSLYLIWERSYVDFSLNYANKWLHFWG